MPFMKQGIWILHTVSSSSVKSSCQRGRRGLVFQQQWVRSSEFAVDRAEIGAHEPHKERSGGRVHGGFLACLHCVTNNNELRFLLFVDGMLCNWCAGHHSFLPGQGSTAFASANTMSATRLCTLVSPSLPCASCRRVDRLEATSFLSAIGVGLLIAVLSGVFTARQ